MFYCDTLPLHKKEKRRGLDSFLQGDRVFTGTYWDEFALTRCSGRNPRILVLGAGHGGCIRPLLAAHPGARIHLVDRDSATIRACTQLHAAHFPATGFTGEAAEAESYPRAGQDYDAIWVDVYTEDRAPAFIFDQAFLVRCRSALATGGALYLNLFSTPCYLEHEFTNPWLAETQARFSSVFDFVTVFPHRRNYTVVGSATDLARLDSRPPHSSLSARDRLFANLGDERWRASTPIRGVPFQGSAPADMLFSQIAAYQRDVQPRWKGSHPIGRLSKMLAEAGAQILNGNTADLTHLMSTWREISAAYRHSPPRAAHWILPVWAALLAALPHEFLSAELMHTLTSRREALNAVAS